MGWVYEVNDECGDASIRANHLVSTNNVNQPPCCVPGHFFDPAKPHGACIEGSPCFCQQSTCHPTEKSAAGARVMCDAACECKKMVETMRQLSVAQFNWPMS